jgi:hypothetical protein
MVGVLAARVTDWQVFAAALQALFVVVLVVLIELPPSAGPGPELRSSPGASRGTRIGLHGL